VDPFKTPKFSRQTFFIRSRFACFASTPAM